MDYNNNDFQPADNQVNNNNYHSGSQPNGMATAALVLGILSIISICCIYGSYIFAGIAITLGLLSRGKNKLNTNALIGIILSIIGMVISTVVIVISTVVLLSSYDSMDDFMNDYESYYEEFYGDELPFDYDSFDYDYDTNPQESDLPNTLTITLN